MNDIEILNYIRDLANNSRTPNQEVYDVLKRHNCDFLLRTYPNLEFQDTLTFKHALNCIAVNERMKACEAIFSQNKFSYAIVKGPLLSQKLYGDPYWRNSKDVDILISRENIDDCKKLLLNEGFVQGKYVYGQFHPFSRDELIYQTSMTHQMASFVKTTGNPACPHVYLDINTDILWGECHIVSDTKYILSFKQTMSLMNFNVTTLSNEMGLIELCLHHYKDMNSLYLLTRGSLKLGLYYDIYLYIKKVNFDLSVFENICSTLNLGQYIYVCLYQTYEIFKDTDVELIMLKIEKYKNETLLNTFGLTDFERKDWKVSLADRLFNINVPEYVLSMLSESEINKIKINELML